MNLHEEPCSWMQASMSKDIVGLRGKGALKGINIGSNRI